MAKKTKKEEVLTMLLELVLSEGLRFLLVLLQFMTKLLDKALDVLSCTYDLELHKLTIEE